MGNLLLWHRPDECHNNIPCGRQQQNVGFGFVLVLHEVHIYLNYHGELSITYGASITIHYDLVKKVNYIYQETQQETF